MKNPILYQGKLKKNNYFEGWYFKVVNNTGDRVFAVIPGLSKDKKDPHCFIQINDNVGYTNYYRFDIGSIKFLEGKQLNISINNNFFSEEKIILDLPNLRADLNFLNIVKYKGFWPNIMGPFSFIPFMQCYHGVSVLNSTIRGYVELNGIVTDYLDGKGYIEKDWGTGFPSSWVWLQGNSFKETDVSIMMSLAHIPWLGSYFPGFLGFFNVGGKTHYFSTYNFSRVNKIIVDGRLVIELKKRGYLLRIKALQSSVGVLKAPTKGSMNRPIKESINSVIEVELYWKNERLYSGKTMGGGLEVVGDIEGIFSKITRR
ncbi:tocopherol cyclase family protein [Thiospirochaeta perfilievii]|nr:tocopherol cyclase family protein [Thiospirochaeta perfilievii]